MSTIGLAVIGVVESNKTHSFIQGVPYWLLSGILLIPIAYCTYLICATNNSLERRQFLESMEM